jgi:acetyl-CoA synthetase
VDRHLAHGRGDKTAIRWLGKAGQRREFSYAELARASNRFANALQGLGVQAGERIFVLMGRLPELYVAVLGALKARCVVTPLFSAFGPEPIATRAEMGDARVLVTTPELYRRKVQGLRERLPGLKHVIVVGDDAADDARSPACTAGTRWWRRHPRDYTIGATDAESMSLLHFTSGTTGRPKGAMHVHEAVLAHRHRALRARPARRRRLLVHRRPGLGHRHQLRHHRAAVLRRDQRRGRGRVRRRDLVRRARAREGQRLVHRAHRHPHDDEAGRRGRAGHDLSALRFMASVGEPLNPEAVVWGRGLRLPFHDNWWQTETGGIMIANFRGDGHQARLDGPAAAGHHRGIVRKTADGHVQVIDEPDVDGELALKTPGPR